MSIFSSHRRKLEPRRRFGTRSFRDKIQQAKNYKRIFKPDSLNLSQRMFSQTGRNIRIVGIIALLFLGYYFVISPKLLISQVQINGNRQVSTQQIQDVLDHASNGRLFLIPKNNFFLMSQGRVNNLLTSSIPTIKEITNFKRSWPHKIEFDVVERTPGFVIQSADQYFLVDEEGVVITQVESPSAGGGFAFGGKNLLVAQDQLVEDFARGEILSNQKLASFILAISKQWASKLTTPLVGVKFPGKASNDVEFVTAKGFHVLFDSTRPVSVQLTNLVVILSKKIKPGDEANLAYIDLRLSNWAYYCYKATPCQQDPQPQAAGTTVNSGQ
jgi:hypothetical protein